MIEAIIFYHDTLEHIIIKCSSISDLADFVASEVINSSIRIILIK